jgi:hypothetical protein
MTPEGVDLLNSGAVEKVMAYLEGRPKNRVVWSGETQGGGRFSIFAG